METAEIKTVIENLMEQYRYSVDAENKHHHAEAIDWNGDTELPSYESAKELLKELESYASHPSPMSAADMTAREYFDGEGSPLTLSKICNDEEKEFLLQHIELYASGKVHQSKQPPMSAEQYDLQKLYDWIMDENRKPSITAFTSSIARNIASEFEFRLSKHKSAMSAEQVDWRQVIKDRVKHFNSIFHSYEARQLVGALYAIDQLVPPSHFAPSPPAKPMSAEQVAQLFDNQFDCYADSEFVVQVQAMTKVKFIEVVTSLSTPSVKAEGFKEQWQEMESEIQKHMDEWDEGARLRAGQATIDLSKIIINS